MDNIKFVRPCKELESEALAYRREHFDCGEMIINGSSLFDKTESYNEWLLHVERYSDKKTVADDWVPGSVFFGVREIDKKIIGVIDIRHELNDFLREYGGHIGYAVRPSERRKGYATEMLRLALNYCRNLGLDKVMVGCYKDNMPSVRTIEKCGGALEKEITYLDGKQELIFWIDIEVHRNVSFDSKVVVEKPINKRAELRAEQKNLRAELENEQHELEQILEGEYQNSRADIEAELRAEIDAEFQKLRAKLGAEQKKATLYSSILTQLNTGKMSKRELANVLSLEKISGYMNRTVKNLLEQRLIERTIPETPNHPAQKFKITQRGKIFLELLKVNQIKNNG